MNGRVKGAWSLLKRTYKEWSDDDCPRMAAALSYYTVFSMPALLVIVMLMAGALFGQEAVEGRITQEVGNFVGPEVARQVETMVESAQEKLSASGGMFTTLLAFGGLLFAATGAFFQLQKALNTAWEVEPDPNQSGLKSFFMKRFVSFLMIVATAILLLALMLVTPVLTSLGSRFAELLPGGLSAALLKVLDLALSLLLFTLVFAAIYKIVPDAVIGWRQVWVGAFATAALFVLGKYGIGLYLGQSNPGNAFGAAGSLAVLLVWIYISAMVFFFGAEFTQVWSRRHGESIVPEPGAVRTPERRT